MPAQKFSTAHRRTTNHRQTTDNGPRLLWLIYLTLGLWGLGAQAETRYVIDEIRVNLRSGAGNEYRILQPLTSGAKLDLLETDAAGNWGRVMTEDGVEGWMPTQYLGENRVARDLLAEAQRQLAQLSAREQQLNTENNELKQLNSTLQAQLDDANRQAQQSQKELDEIKRISSNSINLNNQHKTLMQEHQALQTELDVANAEIERLSDDSNQTWFLYGAIAVAIGVVLTLIVQSIRSRRRYSEWG